MIDELCVCVCVGDSHCAGSMDLLVGGQRQVHESLIDSLHTPLLTAHSSVVLVVSAVLLTLFVISLYLCYWLQLVSYTSIVEVCGDLISCSTSATACRSGLCLVLK